MHHLRLSAIGLIAALFINQSTSALARNSGLVFVTFGDIATGLITAGAQHAAA
jgi:hypothetical protein